jgi:TonB-linked SusC/RagA family outer membrane protein
MKNKIITLLCIVSLFANGGKCLSQVKKVISGIVLNEMNEPMSGAIISVPDNPEYTTCSDKDGNFLIEIPDDVNILDCRLFGYRNNEVSLGGQGSVEIKLIPDVAGQDRLLNVALFHTERKGAYTGSISTVHGSELAKTPGSGFSATLTGRLAGLSAFQATSAPADDATLMYIRGLNSVNGNNPLVVIDGVPAPLFDMNTLDVNAVESVCLLKDAAAKALYGPRASSGVILITTKRGEIGPAKIEVSASYSLQQATQTPETVSPAEYALMRNQALVNDGKPALYSLYELAAIADGTVPSHDWYNTFVNDMASMQRYNINFRGGNNRVKYMINTGYLHQNSLIESVENDDYDPALKLNRFNVLTNVDVALHRYLSCFLNTNVNIDRLNQGYNELGTIMSSIYKMSPDVPGPVDDEGHVITTEYNEYPTYGLINCSGYSHQTGINLNVAYGMNLDLNFLTKGLSLKGVVGYEANYKGTITGSTDYSRYAPDGSTLFGTHVDLPLSLKKESDMRYFINFQGFVNYDRVFNKKHEINSFISYFNENMMKNGNLPYDRLSLIGHVKYGYDSRYFLQGDFTYDGTEQFKQGNRFKFFPTVSAAWVASNEGFLRNANWLTFLKFRASAGWLGNDHIASTRFLYATDVRYELSGYLLSQYYAAHTVERMQGNPDIHYEKSFQQNYGVDITLLDALGISFDYWRVKQGDMAIQNQSIFSSQGIDSNYLPYENLGEMENKGFEAEISYTKKFQNGLKANVKGNIGYNKNKVTDVKELDRTASGYFYPYRETGYSVGQQFGYLIDYSNGNGYYNSQEEIDNSGLRYSGSSPRPGDFVYKDLNNDGNIDERDQAPIDNAKTLPTISYGASVQLEYKNFDFYAQVQGISGQSAYYNGCGIFDNCYQGVYTDLHRNAWTKERYAAGEEISYPALTTGSSSSLQRNEFFYSKDDYLRVKNVVLGYTLPKRLTDKLKASEIRFYLSGTNLLTFTSLKFDNIDPEQSSFSQYPVYRTFNIGLNLNF